MASSAFNAENRRSKALVFLLCCICAGIAPHLLESKISLLPGIVLALLLGGYGLGIVMQNIDQYFGETNAPVQNKTEYFSLPSVDVLVSARDEENVIDKLVKRLSSIEYPKDKLKIVIINDGSNDNTSKILGELIKEFPDLNIINRARNSGGGKSGALNYALQNLQGEWALILDADAKFNADILLKVLPEVLQRGWSAVQLRKAVINSRKNILTICQAMEMAMDAMIQQGRLVAGGVVELRGNGQLIKRKILDECGGFNEETVTDDLDLSFRLLIAGVSIGILWNPPIQEEAVETFPALWHQRKRWTEGGLQRFFDYWKYLISGKLSLIKKVDLTSFFLLQYVLPVVSFVDITTSLLLRTFPLYWPLSLIAFAVSGFAYFRGCRRKVEGPEIPLPKFFTLIIAILYLTHWFIVIPWMTVKMALFPKKLIWLKTTHVGN